MHKFYILWFIKEENHYNYKKSSGEHLKKHGVFGTKLEEKLKIGSPQDIVKINLDTQQLKQRVKKDEIGT